MGKKQSIKKGRAALITHLKRLPASDIYMLAPPEYVKRGYSYYRDRRLVEIGWENDFLVAYVYGNFTYEVLIRYNDERLQLACDCPAYTPSTNCKHIICVLFSLKDLLRPVTDSQSPLSGELRESLLSELGLDNLDIPEETDAVDNLSLVFSVPEDNIYFEEDGRPIKYILHYPVYLQKLSFGFLIGSVKKEDIQKTQVSYVLRLKDKAIPLSFKESLRYRAELTFVAEGKALSVRLDFLSKQQQKKLIILNHNILIEPDDGVFALLGPDKKKKVKFFFNLMPRRYDFTLNKKRFKMIPCSFPLNNRFMISLNRKDAGNVEGCKFLVDKRSTELMRPVPEYHINIVPDVDDNLAGLEMSIKLMGRVFNVPFDVLNIAGLIWRGGFGPLRSAERRKEFFGKILELINSKDKIKKSDMVKILSKEFMENQYSLSMQSYLKYMDFIRYIAECIIEDEYIFGFFEPERRWALFSLDTKRCFNILSRVYSLFEPKDVALIGVEESSIYIKKEALSRVIGGLYRRLSDIDVKVTYKNKPLSSAKWDISIDFNKDIDWFELRPEIRVNDRKLSEQEIRALLESISGGVVETGGSLEIIPENVEDVLRFLFKKRSKRAARNKEIARIPRLQILQWISLKKKGVRLNLPPEEEEVIESLFNFQGIEPVDIPEGFRGKLRRYQREGYYWLCFLYKHRFGACLADDMGLGKTVQTIVFLAALKEDILKSQDSALHLIVVPPSLVFNWEAEIKRFYPSFKVLTYTGVNRKLSIKDTDIVITTYALMRRDIEKLSSVRFDVIVFDEAQAIKNIHAETTKAARKLNARFKLALTGTPVENHLGEYFSIIDLCLPGLMGEYDEFMRMQKQQSKEFLDDVIRRTAPFVLRRTKQEILKELPGKTETDIYLDLTEKQKALYTRTVKEIKRDIDNAYASMTRAQAQVVMLSALMKLRRLCLSPALVDSSLPEESPKVELLLERLQLLMQQGHSALVFSQFTSYLDIVEKRLKKAGIEYLRLDGSTPQKKRKQLVRKFQQDDGQRVFLLSLKAGGQGLNLTRATYVFHLDPWWNPAVEQQATDRTHRIGQKNKVTVIRLLMRHTIEEKMQELKKRKKALYDALLGVRKSARGISLTREDLDFLLEDGF